MINNIFDRVCSFNISKLLKEKGFDRISTQKTTGIRWVTENVSINCWIDKTNPPKDSYYSNKEKIISFDIITSNSNTFWGLKNDYSNKGNWIKYYEAPTLSVAVEWIWVNFGIYISVLPINTHPMTWQFQIQYQKLIPNIEIPEQGKYTYNFEAIEAALEYCLINLVK